MTALEEHRWLACNASMYGYPPYGGYGSIPRLPLYQARTTGERDMTRASGLSKRQLGDVWRDAGVMRSYLIDCYLLGLVER